MVRDLRVFSVRTTKTYRFPVGKDEVHQVQIDKIRPLALAGVRRQQVKAYVDGVLVAEGACDLTSSSRVAPPGPANAESHMAFTASGVHLNPVIGVSGAHVSTVGRPQSRDVGAVAECAAGSGGLGTGCRGAV